MKVFSSFDRSLKISLLNLILYSLGIVADEDHINLLNGKNKIVKLIYIHHGYKYNEKTKKSELINPFYFQANDNNIWLKIKNYIESKYEKVNKIIINSDAALWIKLSIKHFKNVKFCLDKFHIVKTAKTLSGKDKKLRLKILDILINKKDKNILYRFFENKKLTSLQKTLLEYLYKNFEFIRFYDSDSHCSAEGHISHIYSSRMSSRPMGWSEKGAEDMARYRVMLYNKVDFSKLVGNKELIYKM